MKKHLLVNLIYHSENFLIFFFVAFREVSVLVEHID